jgi:hypothetical protein
MTREDKNLLLKDLCARLPYGVKIRIEYPFLKEEEWHTETLYGLDCQRLCIANTSIRLEEFKPYLFPLSSMTEEQKNEFTKTLLVSTGGLLKVVNVTVETYNWLNKNHFDYNGLIQKSLAIDATNLNIY